MCPIFCFASFFVDVAVFSERKSLIIVSAGRRRRWWWHSTGRLVSARNLFYASQQNMITIMIKIHVSTTTTTTAVAPFPARLCCMQRSCHIICWLLIKISCARIHHHTAFQMAFEATSQCPCRRCCLLFSPLNWMKYDFTKMIKYYLKQLKKIAFIWFSYFSDFMCAELGQWVEKNLMYFLSYVNVCLHFGAIQKNNTVVVVAVGNVPQSLRTEIIIYHFIQSLGTQKFIFLIWERTKSECVVFRKHWTVQRLWLYCVGACDLYRIVSSSKRKGKGKRKEDF